MSFFLKNIKKQLAHPLTLNVNMDTPEANTIFSRVIESKPFLKEIYRSWYAAIAKSLPRKIQGPILELGSGAGFLQEYIPGLIKSEVQHVNAADIILDGQVLPFRTSTLRAIAMVDVFHHIPDVDKFLSEADRCLKPGGGILMVEPWLTPWSGLVYKYLHHEPFLPDEKKWRLPAGGPMSMANSALPWIVFKRDRGLFEHRFPFLKVDHIVMHTPFLYLLSGGLSMRNLMPAKFFPIVSRSEQQLGPLMKHIAMFATIVITKKG